MILQNDFELLPCSEEDYLALSKKDSFCFPPYDPLQDDDPVSLDTFFCKVVPEELNDYFVKTYKFVKNSNKDDILALASISNSSFSFGVYESKPSSLRDSGFNEAFPAVMLVAFGVRRDCQGAGIGSAAFNALLGMIRNDSIAGVRVLVLHPLEAAIPFYKSLGFMEVAAEEDESVVESMVLDVWRTG